MRRYRYPCTPRFRGRRGAVRALLIARVLAPGRDYRSSEGKRQRALTHVATLADWERDLLRMAARNPHQDARAHTLRRA